VKNYFELEFSSILLHFLLLNLEVPLDDLFEDYRTPQLQEIPGRIQGLPPNNSKYKYKMAIFSIFYKLCFANFIIKGKLRPEIFIVLGNPG